MELFTIEENQVVIRPELRLVPAFKQLIARDKDRQKRAALSEFTYIYFMHDWKSPYMNINATDRHNQLVEYLKFGADWKPDKDLQAAIDQYLVFKETSSVKALKSIKEALINASKVIDVMNEVIVASLQEETRDMVTAMDTTEKLLSLADKLNKTIPVITALEEKVQKEQHEDSKVRGGGKKGLYEG
jgi:hypothetical protein